MDVLICMSLHSGAEVNSPLTEDFDRQAVAQHFNSVAKDLAFLYYLLCYKIGSFFVKISPFIFLF